MALPPKPQVPAKRPTPTQRSSAGSTGARPVARGSRQVPQGGLSWQAWRIADGRFDPFSPIGASLVGGRWNSPGLGVIYASRTYAGAMLECLAHAGIGRVPKTHVAVQVSVTAAVSVYWPTDKQLPKAWDQADLQAARAFGDAWITACQTAVLVVPSVVARNEHNVLINPRHADFKRITAAAPEAVVWDSRLFPQ
jgi:RES domain-containing protein